MFSKSIYLAPKFAYVFGVDKQDFLMSALDAYHPEVHELIESYLPMSLTVRERQLLNQWRTMVGRARSL